MDAAAANLRRPVAPRAGIAERIWVAARTEFSRRGYHGARVQGIARGASCNVALIYRHWASKRALYLDVLRSVWVTVGGEMTRAVGQGPGGAATVVGAYLDAMLRDSMGAQILIREYLDGSPFLSDLTASEPSLLEPIRRAASTISAGDARVDPVLAVVTVGGLAALVASAQEAARPFLATPPPPEVWRQQVFELLVNGLGPSLPLGAFGASIPATGAGANGTLGASGAPR
jgi:AcrR family transcriptional regulator